MCERKKKQNQEKTETQQLHRILCLCLSLYPPVCVHACVCVCACVHPYVFIHSFIHQLQLPPFVCLRDQPPLLTVSAFRSTNAPFANTTRMAIPEGQGSRGWCRTEHKGCVRFVFNLDSVLRNSTDHPPRKLRALARRGHPHTFLVLLLLSLLSLLLVGARSSGSSGPGLVVVGVDGVIEQARCAGLVGRGWVQHPESRHD